MRDDASDVPQDAADASKANIDAVSIDVAPDDDGKTGRMDVAPGDVTAESGTSGDADETGDAPPTNDVRMGDDRTPPDDVSDVGLSDLDAGRCSAGCPRQKPVDNGTCSPNALACEYGPQCAGTRCLCTDGFWQCWPDWCTDQRLDVVRDEQCVTATPGIVVPTWLTQDNISRIESSGGYVYWVGERYGKVYLRRAPMGGGPFEQIHDQAGSLMAVDGDIVYEVVANRLVKVDVTAGCPTDLADLGPGPWQQIVFDADNVYVADFQSRLMRVAKTTGALTELKPATSVMWRLAVSGAYLYFIRENDIVRYPTAGGNVEPVVSARAIEWMLVDSNDVFWVAPSGDAQGALALYRVGVGGGTPSVLWTSSGALWGMAADAGAIYVGKEGPCGCGVCDDLIVKVPKSGGSPTVLVGGQNNIGWGEKVLTVSNGAIAWLTSQGYAQLWSAPLP